MWYLHSPLDQNLTTSSIVQALYYIHLSALQQISAGPPGILPYTDAGLLLVKDAQ